MSYRIVKQYTALIFLCCGVLSCVISPHAVYADALPGSPERGKELYNTHCSQCHGYKGDGKGTSSVYLPRPPRNFTEGLYKLKTSPPQVLRARDQDIYNSMTNGLVVSGMPSWRDILTDSQRWDLVAYIKTFSDMFDEEVNPPAIDYSSKVPFSSESVERGRIAYREFKCFECHGEKGKGPSIKELKDDYGVRIWPRDLTNSKTYIGEFTPEALFSRVTNGIPLTPMPSLVLRADNDLLKKKKVGCC